MILTMAMEATTKVSAVTANFSTSRTAGKPIICKAAVCRKAGEPLVIEEIEVAPPKAWEVRVKILCTSLCHTDVTVWKLNVGSSAVFPRIFGHEAVGTVESGGDHVEEVKEGDTVLPILLPNCGECRECEFKNSNFCSTLGHQVPHAMARDGTSRFKDMNGETLHHFCFVSSFSEYTVVDVGQVVKVDPRMPIDKACLLGCCVPTGVGSAWKVADVEEGHSVAIFGLGAVGLAVAEGARLRGVSKIIGIDLNPLKFEIAKKFGVTDVINPKECGDSRVSQGGKTIVVGADYSGTPLKFNFGEVLFGRSVIGSLFGGIKPKKDIPIIMQKYINKELRLDGFITHEVSFQEINKAFDYLLQGKSIRCLIWMDE
ncbi:hypothetical protein Droror1_Dr00000301 [Drosera rotundifolia]